MNARQFEDAIKREAEAWPGVSLSWKRCKRHPAVVLRYGRNEALLPYPGSSGDRRAVLAQIASMRAALRALGASRQLQRKSSRPRSLRSPHASPRQAAHAIIDLRPTHLSIDPWARLAAFLHPEVPQTENGNGQTE